MRTTLFRTEPLLVSTSEFLVFVKDLDGVSPVTLYLENVDLAASVALGDVYGSKNSKLIFKAETPGTAGNAKTVTIEEDTDDANGIAVAAVGDDVTYTVGRSVLAWQLIAMASGEEGIVIELAPGSDGSAPVLPVDSTLFPLALAGGLDSVALSTAVVELAATVDGPWLAHSAAGTALGSVGTNAMKYHTFTEPVGALKLTVTRGAGDTNIIASARGRIGLA